MQEISSRKKLLSQETPEKPSPSQITDNFLETIIGLKYDLSLKTQEILNLIDEFEILQKKNINEDILLSDIRKEITKVIKEDIWKNLTFPVEIFDEIFAHCDALTKLNFSATCKGLNERYKVWKEVKSAYITRTPIEFLPNKTVSLSIY